MTKIGKFWTDSTAYLALVIGAGLSIAGNVADTYRTRGQDTDALDIVLAVAWPALVILMVEIFVSKRWVGLPWPMQVMRWFGTLAIGGMAMRVSWVHLNDLMVTRDQKADVATFGPLAIDLLAIMATALILAGRRTVATSPDVDSALAKWVNPVQVASADPASAGHTAPDISAAILADTYATVGDEAESYLARLANHPELDSTTTPAVPVLPGDLPQRKRPAVMTPEMDAEAGTFARIGREHGLPVGDIAELLGGYYGVSARTIRRRVWWPAATRVN